MAAEVWYLAYGSNLLPEKLARYLGGAVSRAARPQRTLTIPRRLYFAGMSMRWTGGVAFIDRYDDPAQVTHVRAYRVTGAEFAALFAGENVSGATLPDDLAALGIEPGGHAVIPMPGDEIDGEYASVSGKYSVVARLADLDGLPCYTITTARNLARRAPDPAYVRVILAGLDGIIDGEPARAYLDRAITNSARGTA